MHVIRPISTQAAASVLNKYQESNLIQKWFEQLSKFAKCLNPRIFTISPVSMTGTLVAILKNTWISVYNFIQLSLHLLMLEFSAQKGTWTLTSLRIPTPQAGASTKIPPPAQREYIIVTSGKE